LDLGLDAGAAGLANDPVDDLFTALIEDLHRVEHHLGSRGRRCSRPARLRFTRLAVGGVKVVAVGQGDLQQALLMEGVDYVELATGTAVAPLPGEWLQLEILIGRTSGSHGVLSC